MECPYESWQAITGIYIISAKIIFRTIGCSMAGAQASVITPITPPPHEIFRAPVE